MAQIIKKNGFPITEAFYGLQPQVVKVQNTSQFTAATIDGDTGEITEIGGYARAVRALQNVASIVWLGDRNTNYFTAVIDGPTFNNGAGTTTAGTYGALKDALAGNCGGVASDYIIAVYDTLEGDATFS